MENKKKLNKDINIAKSFNSTIAGLLIGLGVIINTQTQPPILGALLFSFGLLTIIHLKLPLFTGKIGYLEGPLPLILFFNFVGITLVFYGYCICNPDYYTILEQIAAIKFSKTYLEMLFGGIFCGMLIHFAVKCKVPHLTSMAVILFILIGAEHCVADFPYLLTVFSWNNLIKLGLVILGNSIGAIFIERSIINNA